MQGAEGDSISKVVVEGTDKLVEESVVEVAGIAGMTGVEIVELIPREVEGITVDVGDL